MTEHPFPFGNLSPPGPDPETLAQAVAAIAARDPLFNLDSFLAEAQQAFWLVGQAHARCKPELCASVLAPALAERERAGVEQACRENRIIAPSDGDAESGQLVSVVSDASHDTILVHFASRWRPFGGGRGKEDRHIENWCFQRSAGAHTAHAAGAGERCRNCGALLSGSVGATCRYCGTPIGTADGWRVIRVDEVQAQEAASALAAMRSVMSTMAAAAREQQASGESAPAPLTPAPLAAVPTRRGRGCLGPIVLLILVLAGLGFYAVGSSGSLHRAVAKVFPSTRHARLQGPLDLSGPFVANQVTATQVSPKFQSGGTCAQAAQRTAWDFKAKLADGSTFHLVAGLPPGTGAPGVFRRPQLTVSASAQNASRYESWAATSASTVTLTMQASGGGDIAFTNVPPNETGIQPLSGHLAWSCDLA